MPQLFAPLIRQTHQKQGVWKGERKGESVYKFHKYLWFIKSDSPQLACCYFLNPISQEYKSSSITSLWIGRSQQWQIEVVIVGGWIMHGEEGIIAGVEEVARGLRNQTRVLHGRYRASFWPLFQLRDYLQPKQLRL